MAANQPPGLGIMPPEADHDDEPHAGDAVSVAEEPVTEYREVLLHTEPVVVKRTFMHTLAAAFHMSADPVRGVNATNEINTTKYTFITFLPKNLFEQFTRVANLYFLLMAGLQFIPGLSPTSWFTTVFPLVCVLAVNAIKEAVDDVGRHRSDHEINDRQVLLLSRGGTEKPIAWRDVKCGQVLKVMQDEEVPADCVVLATSDEAALLHVETANLDGETNLKLKYAFEGTKSVTTADQLTDFEDRLAVHTELPNPRLYTFDGAVVDRLDPGAQQLPLTIDNLLLRGSTVRKTSWAIGLVVFAGADSKIMMNRTKAKRKVTQLEHHMNVLVIVVFGITIFLAMMMAVGDQVYQSENRGMWYLQYTGSWPDLNPGFPAWCIQVIRFIILLNGNIPISLYVTLEMVKVLQCLFILNSDRKMYNADTDTRFRCRTTNLNEDLGQVEYVLSDKTGTLTQNVMGFVWASIDKTLYGRNYAANQLPGGAAGGSGGQGPPRNPYASEEAPKPSHVPQNTPHALLHDRLLQSKLGAPFSMLAQGGRGSANNLRQLTGGAPPDAEVAAFFTNLAVCNTVVPQILENGHFVYQASSPDEEALVEGAALAGYRLLSRSTTQVEIEVAGQKLVYKVLVVLEFNSDRKRMSIICKCPDGRIRLFCKGADTMIMTRVRQGQPIIPHVRNHLEEMAQAGYRTLCVAQKELTAEQWNAWWSQYHAASVALEDREHKVAMAAEKIESDMELLGATAVEDKLQDGVPEAIATLVAAGIKVWVLTGDKVETAISIAFSCRLFTDTMAIVELRDRDFERALTAAGVQRSARSTMEALVGTMEEIIEAEAKVLQQKIEEVEAENIRMEYEAKVATGAKMSQRFSLSRARESNVKHSNYVGLVIEGGALAVGLQKEHQDKFMELCSSCRSVVCCRVSPMQKAAVTKLVQIKCQAITLGIGDGANDVGMIQAAHIGCGISGREGRAAVMASDYSFSQFRYLARLLLVHGRGFYRRNVEVVIYSFYKAWMFNLTFIYYAFVSSWSAQPLYTTGLLATLNLFWASVPIISYAFFEQDVSQENLLAYPQLYADSMLANRRSFLFSQLQWNLLGTWHSLVVFFIPVYSMGLTNTKDGRQQDWVGVGCTVYMAIVVVLNLKIALRTRYWTWVTHVLIWLSIGLLLPFYWLYGLVWEVYPIAGLSDMSSIASTLFPDPMFWLGGVILAPALSLLLDIGILTYRRHLSPYMFEVLQEAEYMDDVRRQALRELGVGKFSGGFAGPHDMTVSASVPATILEQDPSAGPEGEGELSPGVHPTYTQGGVVEMQRAPSAGGPQRVPSVRLTNGASTSRAAAPPGQYNNGVYQV